MGHRSAPGVTTRLIPMHAPPTAITARRGSMAACLSAPARGTAGVGAEAMDIEAVTGIALGTAADMAVSATFRDARPMGLLDAVPMPAAGDL